MGNGIAGYGLFPLRDRLLFCGIADRPAAGPLVCKPWAGSGRGHSGFGDSGHRARFLAGALPDPVGWSARCQRRLGQLLEQWLLQWPAAVGAAGTGSLPDVRRFRCGHVWDGLAWVTGPESFPGVFSLVAVSNDQRWRDLQNGPTGRQTAANHETEWHTAERYKNGASHHPD